MKARFVLHTISNSLIIGGALLLILSLWPTVSSETWYWGKKIERFIKCRTLKVNCAVAPESLFAPLAYSPTPLKVEPVSKEFGIVIEKIGVNAPVAEDVSVVDKAVYTKALRHGVAHARGTAKPGGNGNSYLFAHSSLNFWQLGKYATVFNLLRKLERGDKVAVFYKGRRFDYLVVERRTIPGFDTTPLLKEVSGPTLTLQTCHPPGTTLNRLIVTAKLVSSEH